MLAQVKENAELIILDTPPVLAVTDAAVLTSKVDGVILLIEAQQTSHEAARRTYEALQRVGAPDKGTVVVHAIAGEHHKVGLVRSNGI